MGEHPLLVVGRQCAALGVIARQCVEDRATARHGLQFGVQQRRGVEVVAHDQHHLGPAAALGDEALHQPGHHVVGAAQRGAHHLGRLVAARGGAAGVADAGGAVGVHGQQQRHARLVAAARALHVQPGLRGQVAVQQSPALARQLQAALPPLLGAEAAADAVLLQEAPLAGELQRSSAVEADLPAARGQQVGQAAAALEEALAVLQRVVAHQPHGLQRQAAQRAEHAPHGPARAAEVAQLAQRLDLVLQPGQLRQQRGGRLARPGVALVQRLDEHQQHVGPLRRQLHVHLAGVHVVARQVVAAIGLGLAGVGHRRVDRHHRAGAQQGQQRQPVPAAQAPQQQQADRAQHRDGRQAAGGAPQQARVGVVQAAVLQVEQHLVGRDRAQVFAQKPGRADDGPEQEDERRQQRGAQGGSGKSHRRRVCRRRFAVPWSKVC